MSVAVLTIVRSYQTVIDLIAMLASVTLHSCGPSLMLHPLLDC